MEVIKAINEILPLLQLVFTGVLSLVLYSFRATLKLAIYELKEQLSKQYATKEDLDRVEKQVDLAGRVDSGFSKLTAHIARTHPHVSGGVATR